MQFSNIFNIANHLGSLIIIVFLRPISRVLYFFILFGVYHRDTVYMHDNHGQLTAFYKVN